MSSRKIRAVGTGIIAVVIIVALAAMAYVQANNIADVKKSEISKTTDAAVSLSWSKVSSADGYFVYTKQKGEDTYKKSATLESSEKSAEIKNLEQGTVYDIYVTAYKKTHGKTIESNEKTVSEFCTLPSAVTLKASSTDEGVIDLSWRVNENAAGYQIQYTDGSDFKSAKTIDISNPKTASQKIKDLTPKKTYSLRARAYLSYKKSRFYGEWNDVQKVKVAEKVEMASNIDKTKPMVALTFDDGPGYNSASDQILDVLEKYNAKATFFMVGQNAADHPKNVKRKVKLGCQIGNHTYSHNHYGKNVTVSDISKASEAIYKACGQYPTAFRSTGGNTTSLMLKECKKENMPLYYWTLDTEDWKSRDAKKVYNAVMNNVSDGDIILMHEIYSSTAEAVEKMVPELIEQGYQLVTCDELVEAKSGKKPEAGVQYMSGTKINNKTS